MKLTQKQISRIMEIIPAGDNLDIVIINIDNLLPFRDDLRFRAELIFNIYCITPDYEIIWQVQGDMPRRKDDAFIYLYQLDEEKIEMMGARLFKKSCDIKAGDIIAQRSIGHFFKINITDGTTTRCGYSR